MRRSPDRGPGGPGGPGEPGGPGGPHRRAPAGRPPLPPPAAARGCLGQPDPRPLLTSSQRLRLPLRLLHCPVAPHRSVGLRAGREGPPQLHGRAGPGGAGLRSSLHASGAAARLPRRRRGAQRSSARNGSPRAGGGGVVCGGKGAAHMLSAGLGRGEAGKQCAP